MNVLVTGGAGYIGSHLLRALESAGHTPIVYDNLTKGHRQSVADAKLIVGDITDGRKLRSAMDENKIELVIHLAALADVADSIEKPDEYFRCNTIGTMTLLEAMRDCGAERMVFSSTAAVYGRPKRTSIEENDPFDPINPYGASKVCTELMLRAYAEAYGLGSVSLRYFNVAGADPTGEIGEDHDPETHLVPLILQVALGTRQKVRIFGDDYDTPDGTCIRDYIHVCDLAQAHIAAVEAIEPARTKVYNLGNGEGFSVKQVIAAARRVTGHDIPAEVAPRRPGDPPRLVASWKRAAAELGWCPKYPQLETIISHAWAWHEAHPTGYAQ